MLFLMLAPLCLPLLAIVMLSAWRLMRGKKRVLRVIPLVSGDYVRERRSGRQFKAIRRRKVA